MLLPAVCTVLTAIQTFPLDGLHPKAFGEGYNEYPVIIAPDISSKLGWNLHVEPLGNRERPKTHTSAGLMKRLSGKAARTDRFSYNDDPAWKMLLTDTNRFVDAIHKQLKPTGSTNERTFKTNTRMANISLEFTLSNDLANSSDISLRKKNMHTSTATPSNEKVTPQSIVKGIKQHLVPAGTDVLTRGQERAMPQAELKRLELTTTSPLPSDNGKNVLASREPLSQLRGNMVTKSYCQSPALDLHQRPPPHHRRGEDCFTADRTESNQPQKCALPSLRGQPEPTKSELLMPQIIK
ncbi:hypothetical protein MTO96_010818 [Rhipicephalus appendiculatus]